MSDVEESECIGSAGGAAGGAAGTGGAAGGAADEAADEAADALGRVLVVAPPPKGRGPGRPPARPGVKFRIMGVVPEPSRPDILAEVHYSDVAAMKALLKYLEKISTPGAHLYFTPTGLYVFARDHTKQARSMAELPGAACARYFARESLVRFMPLSMIKKVQTAINRNCSLIAFECSADAGLRVSLLIPNITITRMSCTSSAEPDDELYAVQQLLQRVSLESHPVQFTMSVEMLKTVVAHATSQKSLTVVVKVVQNAERQVRSFALEYPSDDTPPIRSHEELSSAHVKLQVGQFPGMIFECAVRRETLLGLAEALNGDARFCCNEQQELVVQAADKNGIMVNTLIRSGEPAY